MEKVNINGFFTLVIILSFTSIWGIIMLQVLEVPAMLLGDINRKYNVVTATAAAAVCV